MIGDLIFGVAIIFLVEQKMRLRVYSAPKILHRPAEDFKGKGQQFRSRFWLGYGV